MQPIIDINLPILLKEALAVFFDAGEVHTRLWWGNLREIDHLETQA
jgi:hypothetical protein